MSWFKKIRRKLNIRKVASGALALLVVLSMIFGLNVVRNPVPTAGLPAEALSPTLHSFGDGAA